MSRLSSAQLAAAALIVVAWTGSAGADASPSVLVKTASPSRGSIPDVVVAYGTAGTTAGSNSTVSLQQDGRITSVAVVPGQQVRRGETLLGFGPSAAAESTYRQAETALSLAQTQRAHTAQLLTQQLATRDQLAQADKALLDAKTSLDALRQEGGGRSAREIVAPFEAVVATVPVTQGDRVAANATLMTLTRLDGLVVTVGVEPSDRPRLRAGQRARLARLRPGPAAGDLQGSVARVAAILNPRTRLLDVDIGLSAGAALSGEAFRATIQVGEIQGWIVPRNAVLVDGKGPYLFQILGGKAVRVDVRLLGSEADRDAVEGSVDASRQIVVEGSNQLDDGANVREGDAAGTAGR